MKPEKSLQYCPIAIKAIGPYQYEVAFQQTNGVVSHIFNTESDFPVGQSSKAFWNAMGADLGPKEMYSCVLTLDALRIERCDYHDIAVYGHSPKGCFKDNKKMAVEPLSITVCGAEKYVVKFNDPKQSEFVFEMDENSDLKVKFTNDFEQFLKGDVASAKRLLEAIDYFHKARTDQIYAE